MKSRGLSSKSRKALTEIVGENAGAEIADLISQMASEIENLRQQTRSNIGPQSNPPTMITLESQSQ